MKFIFFVLISIFGAQVGFSQSDTLQNFAKETQLLALKYSGRNQWGYYLGQNHVYTQQYAEKYYINGNAMVTGIVTHLAGTFENPDNTVAFTVYDVASNKLPGKRLYSFAVKYKDLDLSGKAYHIQFPDKIAVADSFFVAFNVDDYMHGGYDGDTLGMYCGIKNSREPLDLKNFGRNAVQAHNHNMEDWKDFYSQNFTPIATHFALFPIVEKNNANGVEEFAKNSHIKNLLLYPNPALGYCHIAFDLKSTTNVTVTIQSIQGKTINDFPLGKHEIGKNLVKIDLTGIPTGSYLMQVKTEQTVLTSKITIE